MAAKRTGGSARVSPTCRRGPATLRAWAGTPPSAGLRLACRLGFSRSNSGSVIAGNRGSSLKYSRGAELAEEGSEQKGRAGMRSDYAADRWERRWILGMLMIVAASGVAPADVIVLRGGGEI